MPAAHRVENPYRDALPHAVCDFDLPPAAVEYLRHYLPP